MDAAIRAQFEQLNNSLSTARANYGEGGFAGWPEDAGDYTCYINGMELKMIDFVTGYVNNVASKIKVPGVQFSYTRIASDEDRKQPNFDPKKIETSFKGVTIPLIPTTVTLGEEYLQIRRDESWGRFMAAAVQITGQTEDTIKQMKTLEVVDLMTQAFAASTGTKMVGLVRLTARDYVAKAKQPGGKDKEKQDRKDYIVEITSR